MDRDVICDVSQRIKESLQKAVGSASTLEEAADSLCESQEIKKVNDKGTVNSDLWQRVLDLMEEHREKSIMKVVSLQKQLFIFIPNKHYRFIHVWASMTFFS